MTISELVALVEDAIPDLLNQSGRVLYSEPYTLRPGGLYVLGINPGGDPEKLKADTIRSHLDGLPACTKNAYLHENWGKKGEGNGKIQRQVRWLLDGHAFAVIGLPHFSRYQITRSPAVAERIRQIATSAT